MIAKRVVASLLLAVLVLGTVSAFSVASPNTSETLQDGTNLLKNPGFEGLVCEAGSEPGWCNGNWTHDAHDGSNHGNIFTPQGWVTYWRSGGKYGQPEVKTIPRVAPFTGELERIRSGNYALLLFTFYRLQETGVYQVVTGLQPGATVQFSAHAHGWSCDKDDPMGYTCGDPWNQRFQVGIEPNGVADPFSPSVIWSPEQLAPDYYQLIGPVSAQVGASGSVVVFLRSQTKWGYKYQDAYWDDTSLVYTEGGAAPAAEAEEDPPAQEPEATSGPPPTPRPTSTPRPDGAIVHRVESGDTLFGIALEYDVPVDQIRELNAGSLGTNDMINVGQDLVISIPDQAPTATPEPVEPTPAPTSEGGEEATTEEPAAPEENTEQPAAPPEEGASICVVAYHDRDEDKFRSADTEELLPNAQIVLADASGVVGQYTSDGVNEPHCFTGLAAGAYRVIQTSPPGYSPSGPAEWPVALSEGTKMDLQFGNLRDEGAVAQATEENNEDEAGNGGGNSPTDPNEKPNLRPLFWTMIKVTSILMLVLAIGVAVLFFLTRRRR